MLRTLGELQSGLGGLRNLHEQTVKLGEELARKRAAMAQEYSRLTALRQECATERQATERLRGELDSRQADLERAAEELRAVRQELEAGRAELAAARESLLRDEQAGGGRAGSGAKDAEFAARVAELNERLEREAAAYSAQLAEAAAANAALEARLAAAEAELERAKSFGGEASGDEQVEELRRRLAAAERSQSELERELAAGAGPAADALSWNSRRKERLRRYKSLLQMQARKLVTAKEALQKRQAECETMLSQRTKLAAAIESVRQQEKKLASRRARTGAAVVVFASLGSLALVMGLSWAVVNHAVPATYVARAVIEPDGRGVDLGEAEVAAWQGYHVGLARDPRMMEEAADRFRKRGIVSLGTAPELAARLNDGLYLQRQDDGGVVLELRGKGAEKTERELDTFVTALASVANTNRAVRADGAATTITEPAKAGREPVEDPRPVYAAAGAGGGAAATLLFGLVVWTRLAKAKKRYEEEQSLERAMEELAWAAPGEAKLKR